jgi:hypothetical protein
LSIAKHYETGETLPEEIYAKLVAAKNFRAGTFSLRQVRKLVSSYSTCSLVITFTGMVTLQNMHHNICLVINWFSPFGVIV